MSRLQGKAALISGAARGIGEAIARAFLREGARVFVSDVDDATGKALASSLGEQASTRPRTSPDRS